jgi:uncharacterized protein YjiS (DUF1127 family)
MLIDVIYPKLLCRRLTARLGNPLDLLLRWTERAHQRRALAELDSHLLRDIGLRRADIVHEADKPFWHA